jgi:hypothetical protein
MAYNHRYPLTATEILTSDLWVITETAVGHADTLLGPFWDTVLPPLSESGDTLEEADEKERARDEFWSEEDEERDRRREIIKGNWVRVNGWFLAKKPEDVSARVVGQTGANGADDALHQRHSQHHRADCGAYRESCDSRHFDPYCFDRGSRCTRRRRGWFLVAQPNQLTAAVAIVPALDSSTT